MKPNTLSFDQVEQALGAKLIPNGIGTQVLHDAVTAYQANRRAGTHCVKTKGTVAFSGAKPWKQKGTGRARAGYKASPIWRKGGVVFGPHPRDYSKKLAKTSKQAALRKAISALAKGSRISTVDKIELKAPKTKEVALWIKDSGFTASILVVTKEINSPLLQASRNIPQIFVLPASDVNAEHIIASQQVVIEKDALPILAKRING